eukprot:233658_1
MTTQVPTEPHSMTRRQRRFSWFKHLYVSTEHTRTQRPTKMTVFVDHSNLRRYSMDAAQKSPDFSTHSQTNGDASTLSNGHRRTSTSESLALKEKSLTDLEQAAESLISHDHYYNQGINGMASTLEATENVVTHKASECTDDACFGVRGPKSDTPHTHLLTSGSRSEHVDLRQVFAPKSEALTLNLDPWNSVADVKTAICKSLAVPPSEQRLFLGALELKDMKTLHEIGIVQYDKLALTRKPRSCQDLPLIQPFGQCSSARDCRELIECSRAGFNAGFSPELSVDGTGGTYFLRDQNGEKCAAFKPEDEEAFAPNNPRGHIGVLGQATFRQGVPSGKANLREVAAYLIDHGHFSGVPATTRVEVARQLFQPINCDNCRIGNAAVDRRASQSSGRPSTSRPFSARIRRMSSPPPTQKKKKKKKEKKRASAKEKAIIPSDKKKPKKRLSLFKFSRKRLSLKKHPKKVEQSAVTPPDSAKTTSTDSSCTSDHAKHKRLHKRPQSMRPLKAIRDTLERESIVRGRLCQCNCHTLLNECSPTKIGSLQEFVNFDDVASDLAPSMFSAHEVHKIGILDIRLLNTDRNDSNLLVKRGGDSGAVSLIPVDHGLCIPGTLEVAWCDWVWLDWEQSKEPFDQESVDYVMSLDIDADIRKLRKELSINDVALENIRISGKFLQHAVAAGLTLYEIAMIISRSKLDKPSQLEIMCAQAEAMAVNELKGRRRVHPSSPESVRRRRRRGGAPKTQDSHEMAMLSTKSLPQVTSRQTFYSSQDDSSLDDNISILVDRCDSGTDQPPRGMELSRNSLRPASQPSPNGSSARSRIDSTGSLSDSAGDLGGRMQRSWSGMDLLRLDDETISEAASFRRASQFSLAAHKLFAESPLSASDICPSHSTPFRHSLTHMDALGLDTFTTLEATFGGQQWAGRSNVASVISPLSADIRSSRFSRSSSRLEHAFERHLVALERAHTDHLTGSPQSHRKSPPRKVHMRAQSAMELM